MKCVDAVHLVYTYL